MRSRSQQRESKGFLMGQSQEVPQRSQLLMITPLPSVEMACAAVLQEESQKDVLSQGIHGDGDVLAMYSSTGNKDKALVCTACGKGGHSYDKCWKVTGMYPK